MAEGLLEAGAEVLIIGSSNKAAEVAATLNKGEAKCQGLAIDLADAAARAEGFEKAVSMLGDDLDILVNCAGVQSRHASEEFPLEDWQWVLEVNLNAVFDFCQRAANVMLPKGKGRLSILPRCSLILWRFTVPAYAASKGGVMQLTKALSNEWASKGINVNALAPGYMATDMNIALLADEGRNAESPHVFRPNAGAMART